MHVVSPPKHTDGIYFGLAEEIYHADPALGSSDVKRLRSSGPDYWWTSILNPSRPTRITLPHQAFGRAVHKLVLEGSAAFLAHYQREDDSGEVLYSHVAMGDWLTAHGVLKLPRTRAERIVAIHNQVRLLAEGGLLAEVPKIQEDIEREAAEAGREILPAESFDRIVGAAAAIASNEGLATAFQNGQAEVSVFYTVDVEGFPVRCKARFDYLKLGGIGDLKSIRNSRGIDFVEACRRAISEFRYDMQAAHYLEARRALPGLVAAGAVHGATPEVLAWLERLAARPAFAFQWVFYQAEGAPNVKSFTLSPENPIARDFGLPDVRAALRTFATFAAAHPTGEAWRLASPVEELDVNELPAWFGRT